MSFNVETINLFEKQAKRLIKKYASLKNEIFKLVQNLKTDPRQGIAIGKNCFKIRIAIASTVYFISIYDKSEKANVSDKELTEILKAIPH